ncbi:uncharacterized protein [Argopecten irradians]|uniref:uncharacterized protein isoform X2 n=1 Tax=Argopecten irradians TaxID=31199 RepID=UPI003710354D
MLRKMSRKAYSLKESGLEESMKTHSSVFCQRAIAITQKLYDDNPQEAIDTLVKKNESAVWGITEKPLDFARSNKMYTFVAHHVPQRSFNRIWKGGHISSSNESRKSKYEQLSSVNNMNDESEGMCAAESENGDGNVTRRVQVPYG